MADISPWVLLKPCPEKYCSIPVLLNENECIVLIDQYDEICNNNPGQNEKEGIFIYNFNRDEWRFIIEWPSHLKITFPTVCLDTNEQFLYVNGALKEYNSTNPRLILNLLTNEWTQLTNPDYLGYGAKSMMIDGEYHIIGGLDNALHLKWSKSKNEWITMYEFEGGFGYHGLVHIKSRNHLLSFGGQSNYGNCDNLNCFWQYDIYKNEWKLLDFQMCCGPVFGYALSSDERYLFICGGQEDDFDDDFDYLQCNTDAIYVIDTIKWTMRESKIKCPVKYQYHAFIVPRFKENERMKLCAGYARKYIDFGMLSDDILSLIAGWSAEDYLHLMKANEHWKINIDNLLQLVAK